MVIFSSESRISSDSALGSIAVHLQLKLKETLQRFHERRRAGKKSMSAACLKYSTQCFKKLKIVSFLKKSKLDFFIKFNVAKKVLKDERFLKMFQPLCKW